MISLLFLSLIQADKTFFDNPDDAFIMGDSPSTTGEVIITEEQQASGGGGCLYKWNCTNWGECLTSGKQTRNCTNIGTCSDIYKTPEIEQNCSYNASEIEDDKEIKDKNKILIYLIIILVILFIILYLKKDYFKKLIKKQSNSVNISAKPNRLSEELRTPQNK